MKDGNVLIVGSGTMGSGISVVFASAGYKVVVLDKSREQIERGKTLTRKAIELLSRFDLLSDDDAFERISFEVAEISEFLKNEKDFLFALEAVYEDPITKAEVLGKLDSNLEADSLVASTTSGINIYEIAEYAHPERVIITHFFNPPFIVPLVEVVKGPKTSPENLKRTLKLLRDDLRLKIVLLNSYIPGFVVNRLTAALAREAAYIVSLGITSPEDIDTAVIVNYGLKFPFEGIFELFDYIGWDVARMVGVYLFPTLCNSTEGMKLAEDMVSEGRLGLKSGRGLKDYSGRSMDDVLEERWIKMLKVLKCVKNLER